MTLDQDAPGPKFIHSLAGLRESSGFIRHHIRLTAGPSGRECHVELDGHELQCSHLEFTVSAHSHCEVRITIPAAVLDVDTGALVRVFQPVVMSKSPEDT